MLERTSWLRSVGVQGSASWLQSAGRLARAS